MASAQRTVSRSNGAYGRNRTSSASNRARVSGSGSRPRYYVEGNTVRKTAPAEDDRKQPKKMINTARRNRERAKHMSAGYVLFLSAALIVAGIILINYIGLQSDITNSVQHISSLEKQLNDLKLANDEEYSRITSRVNLEEIKRIAIQELGMQYAQEGQIVSFESQSNDYVKQMADIPQ